MGEDKDYKRTGLISRERNEKWLTPRITHEYSGTCGFIKNN